MKMNHYEVSNTELSKQINEILEAVTGFTNPDKTTKEICDDNGEPFKTQDGTHIPNNEFDLEGCHYETDDNGTIYKANGEYYPNNWFVVNGEFFQTDENGMLIKDSSKGKKDEFVGHEQRTATLPDGTNAEATDVKEMSPKGGSYKDVRVEGEGDKYEVHHMPADSASPLERGDGPAIKMEKEDHRQTASCGMSREAREYREQQRELIEQGKFKEALQMDIDDIHEKFGGKYDDAIAEMLEYVDQLEQEGKI